jgi:hypothetical protein
LWPWGGERGGIAPSSLGAGLDGRAVQLDGRSCEQQVQIVEADLAAIGLQVRVRIFAFNTLNALIPRPVLAA